MNWKISFLVVGISTTMAGCMGWVPGRQSYWDDQVRELCKKDGGVTVYEHVKLTQSEYQRLGGANGVIPVPRTGSPASVGRPYVADTKITMIHESTPQVYREETTIVRTSDGKVLSRVVDYVRFGGDFPSPAHDSSYACREAGVGRDIERQTFEVMGSGK